MRPKAFALLSYLVQHPGRLLTKDELLQAVWPQVVVTEDSLTHGIGEVRAALGDSGQDMVRTLTKRGYLFVPAVTAERAGSPPPSQAPSPSLPPATADAPGIIDSTALRHRPRRRLALAAAALVLLLVLATLGVAGWIGRDRDSSLPRLSLVVLPFVHLGADPSQAYLADVISNDLTTALSRIRGTWVIAPSSAVTLKGQALDPKQLGQQLGVRYAVQGTVLPERDRLRISARLINTNSAATLWSDQFDVARGDLLQTQHEIILRLSTALDAGLARAESHRSTLTGTQLDAEDLAMRCDAVWFRLGPLATPADLEGCERALGLDPRNVRALVRLASFLANRVSRVQSPDPPTDIARASSLVDRALAIDPEDAAAHCAKAQALEGEHRVPEAVAAGERCLALNPSNAGAYRILAVNHFFLGRPEQVLQYVEQGMRISPVDIQMQAFLLFGGWAHFMLQHDEQALDWFRKAAAAAPESPPVLAGLTSVLALMGRDAEARAALARYLALPTTRTRTIAQWQHIPNDNPAFRQFDARFKRGLRLAGMAEQ